LGLHGRRVAVGTIGAPCVPEDEFRRIGSWREMLLRFSTTSRPRSSGWRPRPTLISNAWCKSPHVPDF